MIANVPRLSSEPLTLTLQRPTRADFTNHGLAEPLRGEARDLTQYQEITQTVKALPCKCYHIYALRRNVFSNRQDVITSIVPYSGNPCKICYKVISVLRF